MGAKGRKRSLWDMENAWGQKDALLWVKQAALSTRLELGFKKQIPGDSSGASWWQRSQLGLAQRG